MRIRELHLDFFGQFSGQHFDFGPGDGASDFHIIHGPNESGKTTAMEGFLRLLYGFPPREPYDFMHQRKNLRVSGVLEVDGRPEHFTRLTTRSGNLLDGSGTPLPEQAMAAHLGGLALEDYRRLFCLDDDTIEKGGEDIANARGDIGRLLFSAAAGIADLNTVLADTRKQAETLHRKRASKTRLAILKRDLAEVERQIRAQDITVHAWRQLKTDLRTAEKEEVAARQDRDRLRHQQADIAARRRALPGLAEHDRLAASIADCAAWPERLDINPEDLVALWTEQGKLEAESRRLATDIEQAEAERATLAAAPEEQAAERQTDERQAAERLALGQKLDALGEAYSRTATASLDLPRRMAERDQARADLAAAAQALGASPATDPASLAKSSADIATLRQAREAMRDAAQARDTAQREVADLERRTGAARETRAALQSVAPAQTGLSDLLARFDIDTLAPAAAQARTALAAATEQFEAALAALATPGRRFTSLPACPILPETARELASEHARMQEEAHRADTALAGHRETAKARAARIAGHETAMGDASDTQARRARAERDTLWQTHRASLTPASADAFATAMTRLDDIAESRLAHARALGELRQLQQDRTEAETRAGCAHERLAGLGQKIRDIEARVAEAAQRTGLPEMMPATLAAWTDRHGEATRAAQKRDRLATRHRPVLDKADRLYTALLPRLGLEDPAFDDAVAAARRLADRERKHRDGLRAASDEVTRLENDLQQRQATLARLTTAATAAATAWRETVTHLFGDALHPDVLNKAPEELHRLREHDERARELDRRIASMEADQRQFAAAVAPLAARHGIAPGPPLESFDRLRDIATRAAADHARANTLATHIRQQSASLRAVQQQLQAIDRQVQAHAAAFPDSVDTRNLDALRQAVAKGQKIIATRDRMASLANRLLSDLATTDMDDARQRLQDETAAGLEARAGATATDLDRAESRLSAATAARATAARDLATMTGEANVAALVERRATLHLEIEATGLDFLELDLGLYLAEEAIRRYRDRHRSQMMQATSQAFAELTNGAWQRLTTQPDGASEILLAINAGGAARQAGEMSKGTRFQLYLALRAAACEQMLSRNIRLPFFCDDVFETFDEDRTRAACQLMARIGRNNQAIYLTHHRHLLEIAREATTTPPTTHTLAQVRCPD